ncbi:MAG TPA: type II CAAX endopeptidase family protein [Bacillales bacterium]|nr:type II CAAX endopeptidase family protein [Bacillales bacterium]
MPKRYWWVIATYVLMQLSAFLGIPLLLIAGFAKTQSEVLWSMVSFLGAFVVILMLLREDMKKSNLSRHRASVDESILWMFIGVLLAFAAQIVSGMIEQALGVHHASENTKMITDIAKKMPVFIVVVAIIGPILEETVFRKVIFGTLRKRFDFTISALSSSLLFGIAHIDFAFLLTYTAMGFIFAFLYEKTKRILVPIVAHASMNTFVVLIQVIFSDKLEKYIQHLKETESFIRTFLS